MLISKNRGYDIEYSQVDVPDQPSFKSVQALANHAIDLYSEEEIDELNIYYSHYVSVLENKPTSRQVLPLSQEDSSKDMVICLLMNLSQIKNLS